MRRAWLAGSLPGATPDRAMTLALDTLGPHLLALPGGETSRPNCQASISLELAQIPLFAVAKQGDWSTYDNPLLLYTVGDMETLDLGYARLYQQESPIARQLITNYGLSLSYQVSITSPFTLATMVVGPGRALRWYTSFEQATIRDIMQIYLDDNTVIFQVEALLELCGTLAAPNFVRSVVLRKMARRVVDFVLQCPPGIRIGLHPCLGDINHQARGQISRLTSLVAFVNEIMRQWPSGYSLAYVHLPLSEASRPPVTDPAWYTDISRLAVPDTVRIVAGLCHELVTVDELRPIINVMDALLHREVSVGASCGLGLRGGRTMDDAHTVLRQQRELCRGGG